MAINSLSLMVAGRGAMADRRRPRGGQPLLLARLEIDGADTPHSDAISVIIWSEFRYRSSISTQSGTGFSAIQTFF